MHKAVDYNIDLLIAVLVMAMTAPILFGISMKIVKSDYGGFNTQIEKTARVTKAEIVPVERVITRDDIMLMLAVADIYAQSPTIYDINNTIVKIDRIFIENRLISLVNAYNAMPDNLPKKIVLCAGPGGLRKWRIENR